jgi:hypothetical protein
LTKRFKVVLYIVLLVIMAAMTGGCISIPIPSRIPLPNDIPILGAFL